MVGPALSTRSWLIAGSCSWGVNHAYKSIVEVAKWNAWAPETANPFVRSPCTGGNCSDRPHCRPASRRVIPCSEGAFQKAFSVESIWPDWKCSNIDVLVRGREAILSIPHVIDADFNEALPSRKPEAGGEKRTSVHKCTSRNISLSLYSTNLDRRRSQLVSWRLILVEVAVKWDP